MERLQDLPRAVLGVLTLVGLVLGGLLGIGAAITAGPEVCPPALPDAPACSPAGTAWADWWAAIGGLLGGDGAIGSDGPADGRVTCGNIGTVGCGLRGIADRPSGAGGARSARSQVTPRVEGLALPLGPSAPAAVLALGPRASARTSPSRWPAR